MPVRRLAAGHQGPLGGTVEGKCAGCREAGAVRGRASDSLFGQSAGEAERLRLQARMFAPYTARFLQDAGISPGMKGLDVGTGAGDVGWLAAGLAGQQGTVVGIDFNAELIQTARTRAAAAGMENVSFAVGDAALAELERDFYSVVGRRV